MAKFEVTQNVSRGGYQVQPDTQYDTVDFTSGFIDMLKSESIISFVNIQESIESQLAEIAKSTSPANTIVLLGDSITNQNSFYQDDSNTEDRGYFDWANAFLGQRFKVIKNAGIGGNRTDQMLARIDVDVISLKPAWCMLYGGINDITNDFNADVAFANLKAMYQKLLDNNIKVIGATITPSVNINTIARKTEYFKLNKLIRQYALENPNIIVTDFAAAYIDATNTNPVPITNTTVDGVHPSAYGASLMGKILADTLQSIIPFVPLFTNSNNDPDVKNPNAMMIGTGGTLGTGVTGSIAGNWLTSIGGSGVGTMVGSKVARADGMPGEWQQLVLSGGDANTTLNLYHVASTGFSVGEKYIGQSEIELDSDCANIKSIVVILEARNGSTVLKTVNALSHTSSYANLSYNPRKITIKSNPFIVPATITSLRIYVAITMTAGTVRIGRSELRKIG